jgi:hypothetical protein
MQKASSCKSAVALLLASCLIMHMAAASRPLLATTTASALLDSSSSSSTQFLLQPSGTAAPVIPLRRLQGKPVNQAAQRVLGAALKAMKVSSASTASLPLLQRGATLTITYY